MGATLNIYFIPFLYVLLYRQQKYKICEKLNCLTISSDLQLIQPGGRWADRQTDRTDNGVFVMFFFPFGYGTLKNIWVQNKETRENLL